MVASVSPSRSLWSQRPDGSIDLNLHSGQRSAWQSERRFTFVIAGSQGGKTSFGPWWLCREIQRCGPGDYLAVTSSYDLFKLKMLPELRAVFEQALGMGRYQASNRVIELRNPETHAFAEREGLEWGRIILRSASSGAGLESATAKAGWLDECGQDEFTVETWEAVLRRLALHQGRVLGTTTPYNLGFLKTEVYDRWLGGDPDYSVINFPSTANPLYPQAEYDRARATMPEWRFNMFVRGLFEHPPGLIYDSFTPDHVVPDFPIPPEWPRYVGIDFGGVNHAQVWLAQNPVTHALYGYRESLTAHLTTHERAEASKEYAKTENVFGWYGGAKSEGQQRLDWSFEGVPVQEPMIADVESGINAVIEALRARRLYVFRSLRGLRDEFGSYRRAVDDRGETLPEIVNKREYHHLDALRYVVGSGRLGPPNVRFI